MKRKIILIAICSFFFVSLIMEKSFAAKIHITASGDVGIGTTTPQSKLTVNGTITAKEIRVTESGWADYVFSENYSLPPIEEVEKHIIKFKHLPDTPSEETVLKEGITVSEILALHMQKIEELTLYVIQLNKENIRLKNRLNQLEQR